MAIPHQPQPHSLIEMLAQRAEQQGEQLALRFLGDGKQTTELYTYAQLDARVRHLAACLGQHAGEGDRVLLLHGRLPDCALPRPRYDAIICNSLLHHLPDPAVQWQSVNRWAAPGAPVFVVDLRRPPSRAEAQRLTDLYAAGEPDVLRHDLHHSLLSAFEPDEIRAQLRAAGLAHLQVDVPSDRHIVIWGTAR